MYGDLETIEYLLAVEPDTIEESGFEGRSPLLSACAVKGNWGNIKFLIDYGADVTARDENNDTDSLTFIDIFLV